MNDESLSFSLIFFSVQLTRRENIVPARCAFSFLTLSYRFLILASVTMCIAVDLVADDFCLG